MPILSINKLQLHYEHFKPPHPGCADASPLLLLAGMASDSASWQPIVAGLRESHEMIIPDNRCSGRTRPIPVETSRSLMVDDTLALLDALDIERVNILGHSMGGMLGWAIAAQAPERVGRLIAASALPSVIPARISLFNSLSALRDNNTEAHWFELLYQFLFSPEFFSNSNVVKATVAASQAYTYKQSKEAFAEQVNGLRSFLPELDLSRVVCPVTMITGNNDVLMTPDMLNRFEAEHLQVRVHLIANAAHALHWEQPDAFLSVVLEALANGENSMVKNSVIP
ncbi:MAG: alpha/beta fold hydrolase [Granulosicoccus sp.]